MFNGEYTPIPREDPSPSNLRQAAMSTTPNDSDLSASVPGPASGVQVQLPQHLLTPFMQGDFQQPLLQMNPGGVYNTGPSNEPNFSNTTTTGGGDVPIMPYGGPPMTLPVPNVPNGQAGTGNPSASFQVADQPQTMAWQIHRPEVFARPDAQGNPGPLWRLIYAELDHEGSDGLRVVIHFRRIRSP